MSVEGVVPYRNMGNAAIKIPVLPSWVADYKTAYPPALLSVTNELFGYAVAVTNGSTYSCTANPLYTGELQVLDTKSPVTVVITSQTAGNAVSLPAPTTVSFTLLPSDQVLAVYYGAPLNNIQMAEIQVRYTEGAWVCAVVPCAFPTLGFTLNGFGANVFNGPSGLIPLTPFVSFTVVGSATSTYLQYANNQFGWGPSQTTFTFQTFPETGGRNMLCDATGASVFSVTGSQVTSVPVGTWRQTAATAFEQWGAAPAAYDGHTLSAMLVYQNGAGDVFVLRPGAAPTVQPWSTAATAAQQPGFATYITAAAAKNGALVVVPGAECPAVPCAALTSTGCPQKAVNCTVSATAAGALACKSCTSTTAGTADPSASQSVSVTSYLVAGTVTVSPGGNVLIPAQSLQYAAVTFPFTLTMTVTLPADQRALLSVDPISVTVDTSVAAAVVRVPYSAACGYEYKLFAEVITVCDADAKVASVTVRPYAPATNGFLQNSFGTPSATYAGARQGFYFGNSMALVPGTWFSWGATPYCSFLTNKTTKRQVWATMAVTTTGAADPSPGAQTGTLTIKPAASMWGALQVFVPGVAAASKEVILMECDDGSNAIFWYAVTGSTLHQRPMLGNMTYNNPPGFARAVLSKIVSESFVLNTDVATDPSPCWSQTMYGCPGDAAYCRFGKTEAGAYTCGSAPAPAGLITDVCANVYNTAAPQVGCRDVAGSAVTTCSGYNSDNFAGTCREACAANPAACDLAMASTCANHPNLPDCACLNVTISNFPVASKGGVDYPTYACNWSNSVGQQVGLTSWASVPQCWWPTCSLTDGGYVPSNLSDPTRRVSTATGGGGCPTDFTQCLNLISGIAAYPENVQIAAVNQTSSKGGCAGVAFPTTASKQPLCTNLPAGPNAYVKPAPPGRPPPPAPPSTASSFDKLFVNSGYNSQSMRGFKKSQFGPKSALNTKKLDLVAYVIIGVAAAVFVIVLAFMLRTSQMLATNKNLKHSVTRNHNGGH